MGWDVILDDAFAREFAHENGVVLEMLQSKVDLLRKFGPQLGRPHVDTLKGSKHVNMKELRFYANQGVWRVAFAFDPKRKAILLCAGDKAGMSENKFYAKLIETADKRFDEHIKKSRKQS